MKYETQITHNILIPFKYAKEGEFVDAKTITVKAPSNKVLPYLAVIQQEYAKSMFAISEKSKEIPKEISKTKTNDNSDAEGMIFLMSANSDMQKVYDNFRKILVEGNAKEPICVIDNSEKMTMPIYEDISPRDINIILGRYIISFLGFSQNN